MKNKRLFSLMGIVFLFGMLFGFMGTNLLSEKSVQIIDDSKVKMVVEEISTTTPTSDVCSQNDLNDVSYEDIDTVDSKTLLKTLVKSLSDEKGVVTIKHDNYTIEYIVNKNLGDDVKVYINRDYSKYLNYLPVGYMFFNNTFSIYFNNESFYKRFTTYKSFESFNRESFRQARARSPGKYVDKISNILVT